MRAVKIRPFDTLFIVASMIFACAGAAACILSFLPVIEADAFDLILTITAAACLTAAPIYAALISMRSPIRPLLLFAGLALAARMTGLLLFLQVRGSALMGLIFPLNDIGFWASTPMFAGILYLVRTVEGKKTPIQWSSFLSLLSLALPIAAFAQGRRDPWPLIFLLPAMGLLIAVAFRIHAVHRIAHYRFFSRWLLGFMILEFVRFCSDAMGFLPGSYLAMAIQPGLALPILLGLSLAGLRLGESAA